MMSTVVCEKTLAEYFADKEPEKDDLTVVRLRYLPLHRLAGWDLRYENGLDTIIYVQNFLEEE